MPPRHLVIISDEYFSEHVRRLDCVIPPAALPNLKAYLELLTLWNKVMNLVGVRNWWDALHNLVADSFYLAEFLDCLDVPPHPSTWDLGAGAGLPGIPLRMVWEKGDYTLVEAREKRALFLSTVLARLPLPRTMVFQGRAEDFFAHVQRPADIVVSRAFMPWSDVLALVQGHLAPGGVVVLLALAPPPATLPEGWSVARKQQYKAGGGQRWFWALRRTNVPHALEAQAEHNR